MVVSQYRSLLDIRPPATLDHTPSRSKDDSNQQAFTTLASDNGQQHQPLPAQHPQYPPISPLYAGNRRHIAIADLLEPVSRPPQPPKALVQRSPKHRGSATSSKTSSPWRAKPYPEGRLSAPPKSAPFPRFPQGAHETQQVSQNRDRALPELKHPEALLPRADWR